MENPKKAGKHSIPLWRNAWLPGRSQLGLHFKSLCGMIAGSCHPRLQVSSSVSPGEGWLGKASIVNRA